jgi:type IV pilus assembly protein PilY1
MLVVAANDGMLHFFDSGIPRRVSSGGKIDVEYDRGTGREVGAFVPRSILPKLKTMSETVDHQWSVDGSLAVADIFLDPVHDGTPTVADREWRTVLVAGLRRGGESVYALDITQPDPLREVTITEPVPNAVLIPDISDSATVPPCWNATGSGGDDCDDDIRFLEPLWEFTDTVVIDGIRIRLDEEELLPSGLMGPNGEADFAQSWSKPNLGRIQVDVDGTVEDRFVAIFGGGIDPDKKDLRGNWLYIVDVETGRTIYKEPLIGSAPSEPAAVDTNQDGLLDRVYIPTTKGLVYRVDLGPDSSGNLPSLSSFTLLVEVGGVLKSVPGEKRISGREPRVVFDGIDAATGTRLPFYFRPSVIFTPLLSPSFGLAIGEGDREDLWSVSPRGGRFYVFADDTDLAGGPILSSDLERLTPGSVNTSSDFLFEPDLSKRHGWYIELEANERVVADAFALSGITFFSTFIPEVESTVDPENRKLRLCSRRGDSRAFATLTNSGNGALFDANSNRSRSMDVNTLVSRAFADLAISKAPPPTGGDGDPPTDPPPPPSNLDIIADELKKLFPSNCRFANYSIDIRAIAADTEVVDVARVPVCLIEKNWREF